MGTLPFVAIIKQSWNWAFHNRALWFFGLFASSGGVYFQLDANDWENLKNGLGSLSALWDALYQSGFLSLYMALIGVFSLLMIGVSILARAALIRGFNKLNFNEGFRLLPLLKDGWRYFGKLIQLELVFLVGNLIIVALAVLYYVFPQLTWLFVIAAALFVVYNVFLLVGRHYSYCFVLIEQAGVRQSINDSLQLIRRNWKNVIYIVLVELALCLTVGLGVMLAVVLAAIPFLLLGILVVLGIGVVAVPFIIMVVAFVCFVVVLVGAALANTFLQAYLTNVFFALKGNKRI